MIRLDDRVWILWAIWFLLLPFKWVMGAFAAACIHEAGHIFALRLLGGSVRSICVTPFGAVIHTEGIWGWRASLCAMAGPLSSFAAVLFIRCFPVFGLCALAQGLFNLLPVYPLDGGKILNSFLCSVLPDRAAAIGNCVKIITYAALMAVSIWIAGRWFMECWPVFVCVAVILKAGLRKKP